MDDNSKKAQVVSVSAVNRRSLMLAIAAALGLMAIPAIGRAQTSKPEPASFQEKATQAQARIRANENDLGQLKRAIKLNEVSLAKQVLLRNGFTAEDLENAKIALRTGGGKGPEIEISATCCDPKQITIQRSLDYFTK